MAQHLTMLDPKGIIAQDRQKINDNFISLATSFAGETFPTSPYIGMTCYRTDLKRVYRYVDMNVWRLEMDLNNVTASVATAGSAVTDQKGNIINETYARKDDIFVGATSANNGKSGLVPAPMAGEENFYLAGNKRWTALPNDFVGATSAKNGVRGFVPAPPSTNETQFLGSSGRWENLPKDYITVISISGKNISYVKKDGSSATLTTQDTTYSNMKGATASSAGKSGLVPAPTAGATTRLFRADGTWVDARYCIGCWSSGTEWWRKYSDGWVEQGGRFVDFWGWINFHVRMKDTNFTVLTGKTNSGGSYTIDIFSISTTGMDIHGEGQGGSGYSCNATGSWYVCGWAA